MEVVRKDRVGRTLRISKYLQEFGRQKPVSEQIYYSDGHCVLYVYDKAGQEVERVIHI